MKLFKAGLFFVLLLAVCLPVQAQLQANIPFNFVVAGKSLPAGHYKVMQVSLYNELKWLVCNEHDGVIVSTAAAGSNHTEHRPSFVFLATDGNYSLMQFWTGADQGRELILRPRVKTTIVAEGAKYVEIGAE